MIKSCLVLSLLFMLTACGSKHSAPLMPKTQAQDSQKEAPVEPTAPSELPKPDPAKPLPPEENQAPPASPSTQKPDTQNTTAPSTGSGATGADTSKDSANADSTAGATKNNDKNNGAAASPTGNSKPADTGATGSNTTPATTQPADNSFKPSVNDLRILAKIPANRIRMEILNSEELAKLFPAPGEEPPALVIAGGKVLTLDEVTADTPVNCDLMSIAEDADLKQFVKNGARFGVSRITFEKNDFLSSTSLELGATGLYLNCIKSDGGDLAFGELRQALHGLVDVSITEK